LRIEQNKNADLDAYAILDAIKEFA
jgi:hypothetical protein